MLNTQPCNYSQQVDTGMPTKDETLQTTVGNLNYLLYLHLYLRQKLKLTCNMLLLGRL